MDPQGRPPAALPEPAPGPGPTPAHGLAPAYGLAEVLGVVILAGLFGLLLTQIVLRALGSALVWAEEFSIVAFIWLAFLGVVVALRRGEHLDIELGHMAIAPRLPARARRIWDRGLALVALLFFLALALGLAIMAYRSWNIFAGSISGFRRGYTYLGVLACVILALPSLVWAVIRGRRPAP